MILRQRMPSRDLRAFQIALTHVSFFCEQT